MSDVRLVLVRILVGVTLLGGAGAALAAEAARGDGAGEIGAPEDLEEDGATAADEEQIEDLVADAQRLLRASGYDPGPVDGQFGPRTQQAIRAYQAAARRYGTLEAIKGPPPDELMPRAELAGAAPDMPDLEK